MSTVMRPRGPLPPRIYWTRRVLVAVLVLLLVAFVWWLLPGDSPGSAAADPGASSTTTPSQTTPDQGEPTTPATTVPTRPSGTTTTTRTSPTSPAPTSEPPLSEPTGPCDPTKVALTIDVKNAVVGHGTAVKLRMSTTDSSTCSLGITPHVLELRVVKADGTSIWRSTSCPDGLAAKNVVVRPTAAVVYSFGWDGRRNPDACSTGGGTVAGIGGYRAEASLIGGEPTQTAFAVIAPLPPPTSTGPTS